MIFGDAFALASTFSEQRWGQLKLFLQWSVTWILFLHWTPLFNSSRLLEENISLSARWMSLQIILLVSIIALIVTSDRRCCRLTCLTSIDRTLLCRSSLRLLELAIGKVSFWMNYLSMIGILSPIIAMETIVVSLRSILVIVVVDWLSWRRLRARLETMSGLTAFRTRLSEWKFEFSHWLILKIEVMLPFVVGILIGSMVISG